MKEHLRNCSRRRRRARKCIAPAGQKARRRRPARAELVASDAAKLISIARVVRWPNWITPPERASHIILSLAARAPCAKPIHRTRSNVGGKERACEVEPVTNFQRTVIDC